MKQIAHMEGFESALNEISESVALIKDVAKAALWEAGLRVQEASQKRVPVDTGNLRGSAYTRTAKRLKRLEPNDAPEPPSDTLSDIAVEIGYTAEYALNVHEMVEQKLKGQPRAHFGRTSNTSDFGPVISYEFGGGTGKGTYWDSGQPKFLESVITENKDAIIEIIRKRTAMEVEKKQQRANKRKNKK